MKSSKWILPLALLAAAIGVAVWSLPGRERVLADLAAVREAVTRPVPKIALIGLDGADWNVMRPLMAEGRLPVLSSLVESGASGDLRSLRPMLSPALWTTVVTGVGAESHGVRDFVFKQPGSYAQPIVNSSVRKRLALWNILSELDITVGVVDWYATWPAEEVNGFLVSDRIKSIGAETEGVTYPAYESLEEVLSPAKLPRTPPAPALSRLTERFDTLPPGLNKALKEDLYRYSVARSLYQAYHPDFFAFYFKGIDAVGHFYWKYFEPTAEVYGEVSEDLIALLGSVIPDYYELCDQLLGDFLKELDEDTTVLIISDHGFQAFGRPDNLIFDLDRLLSVMGLLEFEDPALAGQRSERKIRMASTRAYTHKGTQIVATFGERDRALYLNVAGRDPDGVIDEHGWRQTREEIKDRLAALRTDLGSRVFSQIRINEQPPGESAQQEPDLVVRLNREIAFDYELLVEGRPYSLYDVFLWEYGDISGTHRDEGILVARGPAIRAGVVVDSPSLLDIAPTILHLAGVPVPRDFEGQVIREMLVERGAGERLVVESYEEMIERSQLAADDRLDEEYRDRLRALGYVE